MIKIKESLFFIPISIILLAAVFKGLSLPFYWDTAAFLIPAAEAISKTGNLLAYVQGTDYPHFFLLPLILSFFISFPQHIFVIHFIGYLLSVFFLIVMYYLGKTVANKSVGVALATAFLTNPLFLAQTNLVYFEVIGTAFRYLAIIFLLKKRYILFLIAAILAFVREYNALVLFIVGLVYLLLNTDIKLKLKWSLFYLLPIVVATSLWLISHYLAAGWWLYSPERYYDENHIGTFIQGLEYLFFAQGRWIYGVIFVLAAFLLLFYKRRAIKNIWPIHISDFHLALFLLLASSVATLGRITLLGYFLQRHIFPLLPVFYLLTFLLLQKLLTHTRIAFWGVILVMLLVQYYHRYDCRSWNLEDCMTVYQLIENKKQAVQQLDNYGKFKTIGVTSMDGMELTNQLIGYVNESLNTINPPFTSPPDVIYLTPTSDEGLISYVTSKNYQLIHSWSLPYTNRDIRIFEKIN